MVVLFWASIALLAYTYLLYPLIMVLWSSAAPNRIRKRYHRVPVSVVIPHVGRRGGLTERLANLLDQDYPAEFVEIIVVAEGPADQTIERTRKMSDPRIRVIESSAGVGEVAAINLGIEQAQNDIIILTDHTRRLAENALAELVAVFEDTSVGAAVGEVIVQRGPRSKNGVGIDPHGEYEKLISQMESEVDSVVGADGAVIAVRRQLFKALPEHVILPDLPILVRVVQQGFRAVFVRSVRAIDSSTSVVEDFAGRVRTLAGHFQVFALDKTLLNPVANRLFFQMVSHRLARLFTPYLLVTAIVSNIFLDAPFFKFTLVLQLLFYASALLRFTPLATSAIGGLIGVAWTFTVHNAAAVIALGVFLNRSGRFARITIASRRRHREHWKG